MTSGRDPDPPYVTPSVHDPNNPMYRIQEDTWEETPDLFPAERANTADTARRDTNNKLYHDVGNCATWNSYVAFGFHQFADCVEFAVKWEAVTNSDNPLEKYKLIWNEYTQYLIHREEPTNSQLYSWTHNLALPYLSLHAPDYHLASVYKIEDAIDEQLSREFTHPQHSTWTEIQSKKKRTPPSSPIANKHNPTNAKIFSSLPSTNTDRALTPTNLGTTTVRRRTGMTLPTFQITQTGPPPNSTDNPAQPSPDHHNAGLKTKPILNPYKNRQTPMHAAQYKLNTSHNYSKSTPNADSDATSIDTKSQAGGFFSTQSTMNTKTVPFIPINDGTIRMTIKWSPPDNIFDTVRDDTDLWDREVTVFLLELFSKTYSSQSITFIPWGSKNTHNPVKIEDIAQDDSLHKYRSPKISTLDSTKQYIFGIRVCLGTASPGKWITDQTTKTIMQHYNLQIHISNAKSDSGDVITAGTIFFKHPGYTQRTFYLMSLRRTLPPSTPYFDLGVMKTTSQGQNIPHIVVRCGANHVDTLTEILSDYLDGGKNNTALYMGHKVLRNMSQEEASDIYELHQQYVTSIQRLSLHPMVVNIDRIRKEYSGSGQPLERATREWVTTLRTPDGNPMKCDIENGGDDKRAYLLVPSAMLPEAKAALAKYKDTLRHPAHQSSRMTPHDQQDSLRPTEIYVPTAAVLRNLLAMKQLQASSHDIWQAAPASVRAPDPAPPPQKHRFDNTYYPTSAAMTPQAKNKQSIQPTNVSDSEQNDKPPTNDFPPLHRRRPSTDTTHTAGTTQSPMTRYSNNHMTTQTIQDKKFEEMEAAFLHNQEEFMRSTTRMNALEDRVTRTMSACEMLSNQVATMDSRFTRMFEKLEQLLMDRVPPAAQPSSDRLSHLIQPSAGGSAPTYPPCDEVSTTSDMETQRSFESSTNSTIIQSPEKKKQRPSQTTAAASSDAATRSTRVSQQLFLSDQTEDQYTSTHLSDGGVPE
jgi:hypothetical protein